MGTPRVRDATAFAWKSKVVLVTGGTGTFGQAFIRSLLERHDLAAVRVLSRDELKQWEFARRVPDPRLRMFIGDVRERDRLLRAFDGVDVVVHAAALKQVPACEYNPFEAVKTNVLGAQNVIDAAIERGVGRVIALSTDKAASPVNLYGATKLCAEKLFVQGNAYVGDRPTRFACVRYGNVVASRGSVVPLFVEHRPKGWLPITDLRMTRFWITVGQAVRFVEQAVASMTGGEIFVPKLPSVKVVDLAAVVAPECELREVGIRPGEKLHETLVTTEEQRRAHDADWSFLISPEYPGREVATELPRVRREESYSSDTNDRWLTTADIARELPHAMHDAAHYEDAVIAGAPEDYPETDNATSQ